jgi:acyl-[acyl-carrier-protein]-phospholipid O-acyltransferase / long-chain-fatty-acid--[acyl-carrier-protein] ligase
MDAAVVGEEKKYKVGGRRGFIALVVTMFQGAFNDNAYCLIITLFLLNRIYIDPVTGAADPQVASIIIALGLILLAIPFLLFPGLAGALADRYSKRQITIWTKWWEVGVMILGLFAFRMESPYLMGALYFLMCMQSAFFSPAKYGILPEIFPESSLSWGNGIVQMATFVAIIAGTGIAGLLFALELSVTTMSFVLIGLSLLGLVSSYFVSPVAAAAPGTKVPVNPYAGLGRYFKVFWTDKLLYFTILGGVFFWFMGAIIKANILAHGEVTMGLSEIKVSALAAALALGIGLGSIAAGILSRRKIELGLVPVGVIGMFVFFGLLGFPGVGFGLTLGLLLGAGAAGGFFDLPLAATLQHRSPDDMKGGMIAAFNIVTMLGVLAAGVIYLLMTSVLGLSTYQVFFILALASLLVGVYLCLRLPLFMVRTVLWILGNTLYRVKAMGRENVPEREGALLVANHTSFVDALILAAAIDRPLRFIMSKEIYEVGWIRPLAKLMHAIPVSPMAKPKELLTSLHAATEAIKNGELVCIFAEGQITRTGQLLPFLRGFERIMKGTDASIIPVHLDRLWGSIFSYSDGKFFMKLPRRIPYPVTVSFGPPLPGNSTSGQVRKAIQTLGTETYLKRDLMHPLLHRGFVRYARRHPLRTSVADATVPGLANWKALVGSIAMARKFREVLGDEPMVGVLVPPTVGGAITNIALTLMGKTVVNLNYTASNDALASAARQCGITQVITARAFLAKVDLEVPGESIYLENIKKSMSSGDRLVSMAWAALAPVRLLERSLGGPRKRSQDDLATVIFSSGSEGEPKGVMLSHFNISSNIEGAVQIFPHDHRDSFMGILPFFHSFGYMATLWLPLITDFGVVFHPNPLEAKVIGQLIYKHKVTFLIAAPTFLQGFIRRCVPEEMSSLKYVITGAEKLPKRIRETFKSKFGIEPLEGYGTTECAPGVSFNIPDFRAPGFYQVGTKHGTVGHPIPGISLKVTDPDTEEELPLGEAGLLHVKGPNIMQGYLGQPERTAKVLKDGWYCTGDIAFIDEDGFITITDRLSRFSKIAGEMVPHTTLEETLHTLLGLTEQSMAVTGVPDLTKGERLVVLHTMTNGEVEELVEKMSTSDLPNLWRPRINSFYRIDAIPVLGTGKLDLKRVKSLAKELDVGE